MAIRFPASRPVRRPRRELRRLLCTRVWDRRPRPSRVDEWIATSTPGRKALVPHRDAPLTETGRLHLARCVVEDGWPLRRAAERFQVSPTTAQRWADRYRALGEAGMGDRSSRPHHTPRRTPTRTERRIIKVRLPRRWGPARIAHLLGLVPSTVHRVLTRYRLARLTHLDRATGHVIRRYEREKPGELVHVDIKKLATSPTAAGTRPWAGKRAARPAGTPATATCTPPSTTTPASPTARSTRSSLARWTFVLRPPRERPSAWSSGSARSGAPFSWLRRRGGGPGRRWSPPIPSNRCRPHRRPLPGAR